MSKNPFDDGIDNPIMARRLPDGREVTVYPLLFGRARLGVGPGGLVRASMTCGDSTAMTPRSRR
jgi:hypothetical protein